MNELPPDIAALLEAARDDHEPTAENRERVLRRVYATTGLAAGSGLAAASSAASKGGLTAGSTGKLAGSGFALGKLGAFGSGIGAKMAGSALLVASLGGGYALFVPQKSAIPVHVATSAQPQPCTACNRPATASARGLPNDTRALPTPSAETALNAAPQAALSHEEVRTVPPAASTARSDAHKHSAAHVPKPVTEELRLLRDAQAALRDGKPARALALLREHSRRFASGTFEEERRGAEVLALCGDGQLSEGRRAQRAFLRDAPASPLAERVRTACGGDGGQ